MTSPHNNVILTIRMNQFSLLNTCIYADDMLETMHDLADDSLKTVHDIFRYVPISILKYMLETKPESDIMILDCFDKTNNQQILYAYWKKNKMVPESLEEKWLDTMGPVKDQGYHQICWAVVASEIISAVRYIKKIDTTKIEYSIQDIVDFTNPEERSRRKDNEHYCYPWMVSSGLEYVRKFGIEKEASRPFHAYDPCPKDVPPRCPSTELSYVSEVVWLNKVEDALLRLKEHPISANIPIFLPEYETIKEGVYHGPTTSSSAFVAMHAINIIGAGELNGDKYVLCRSSHGKGIGVDGNLKVSIEVMMVCLTPNVNNVFYPYPQPLLTAFTFPKVACSESWIIDIDPPPQSWVIDIDPPDWVIDIN